MTSAKLIVQIAFWAIYGAGVVAGFVLDTPFSHRMPSAFWALTVGACLVSLGRFVRRRGGGRIRGAMALLQLLPLITSLLWASAHEWMRWKSRLRVTATAAAQLRQVGQHLMVGYKDVDDLRPLVARGAIGGVFITTRNLVGRDVAALRDELVSLQALRMAHGLPPLIVAADQEGGEVSRLSPWLTAQPPLAQLAQIDDEDERRAAVVRYAAIHGRELAQLGVTLNFGPVTDLRVARRPGSADLYSQIAKRAIDDDPRRVREVAHAYATELARWGVLSTFKHFPGLGRVPSDTHFFSARLPAPLQVLRSSDWLPYRTPAPDHAVMLAHVRLADGQLASMSKKATAWLRDELGFEGPVITDDLCMVPAWARRGGAAEFAVRAIEAGVDMVLVALDPRQVYRVLDGLLDARVDGRLSAEHLVASKQRLARVVGLRAREPAHPIGHARRAASGTSAGCPPSSKVDG